MYRLSRKEMRIIEETKQEGAELQKLEETEGLVSKRMGFWSILALAAIFVALVLLVRLVFVALT